MIETKAIAVWTRTRSSKPSIQYYSHQRLHFATQLSAHGPMSRKPFLTVCNKLVRFAWHCSGSSVISNLMPAISPKSSSRDTVKVSVAPLSNMLEFWTKAGAHTSPLCPLRHIFTLASVPAIIFDPTCQVTKRHTSTQQCRTHSWLLVRMRFQSKPLLEGTFPTTCV